MLPELDTGFLKTRKKLPTKQQMFVVKLDYQLKSKIQ